MEGEHFVIDDIRRLISSCARPSKDPVVEASSRVRSVRDASGLSISLSRGFSSAHPAPSRGTRSSLPKQLPLLERGAGSIPRVVNIRRRGTFERRNVPGSRGEDFVPWVGSKPEGLQDLEEEEEEEREERMTRLLDRYAARKRKRQISSNGEFDTVLAQAAEPSQPAVKGGSEVQAIIILGSLESGPTDQTEPTGVIRIESKEADPVSTALQVFPLSDQAEDQPRRSKFTRTGLPRPSLPDLIITNCYLPPHGPEPPRVEVSAPGPEEVKQIMRRWEPFNCGESAAVRLNNLYPHML